MVRKRNEGKVEVKQYERIQNREKVLEEDINSGRFFELATDNEKYVTF